MTNTLNLGAIMAAFKDAGNRQQDNTGKRMSLECMEAFFYIAEKEQLEMRQVTKMLGYSQTKTHRTLRHLRDLGWVKISTAEEDERQRNVEITEDGKQFNQYLHFKAQT